MKKAKQLELIKKRGGKRKGSGRKKESKEINHVTRARISKKPAHVTMRLLDGFPNLRTKKRFKVFKRGIQSARDFGLRVLHFSLQSNHFHMIVEADSNEELASGMQSLTIRLAKSLNRELRRKGRVFEGRFHLSVLDSGRKFRHALAYVLLNTSRHLGRLPFVDYFSSGAFFGEWKKLIGRKPFPCTQADEAILTVLSAPRSFWASYGWRRYGGVVPIRS